MENSPKSFRTKSAEQFLSDFLFLEQLAYPNLLYEDLHDGLPFGDIAHFSGQLGDFEALSVPAANERAIKTCCSGILKRLGLSLKRNDNGTLWLISCGNKQLPCGNVVQDVFCFTFREFATLFFDFAYIGEECALENLYYTENSYLLDGYCPSAPYVWGSGVIYSYRLVYNDSISPKTKQMLIEKDRLNTVIRV